MTPSPQPQSANIVQLPGMPAPERKRMTIPTVEECVAYAATIGLSDLEARKFWHWYDSKGWLVGRTPMVRWHGAMVGWKLRHEEQATRDKKRTEEPSLNMKMLVWRDELKRVEETLKWLKGARFCNGRWDDDRSHQEFKRLVNRKAELVKRLGMSV